MRILCQLVVLGSLWSGCVTHKSADAFSELPLSPPKTPQQVYPMPEPASESVRQKALAAYAKTHWFLIYPEMRSCTKVEGIPGYSATFGKSGQPLLGFPKEETMWNAMEVEFDDALQIVNLYGVVY